MCLPAWDVPYALPRMPPLPFAGHVRPKMAAWLLHLSSYLPHACALELRWFGRKLGFCFSSRKCQEGNKFTARSNLLSMLSAVSSLKRSGGVWLQLGKSLCKGQLFSNLYSVYMLYFVHCILHFTECILQLVPLIVPVLILSCGRKSCRFRGGNRALTWCVALLIWLR